MIAYVYQAAFICDTCADEILARQSRKSECSHGYADDCDDSGCRPQYAGTDGGGEADSPQHCDICGLFLQNPLTDDGRDYVRAALKDALGQDFARRVWAPFYGFGE